MKSKHTKSVTRLRAALLNISVRGKVASADWAAWFMNTSLDVFNGLAQRAWADRVDLPVAVLVPVEDPRSSFEVKLSGRAGRRLQR